MGKTIIIRAFLEETSLAKLVTILTLFKVKLTILLCLCLPTLSIVTCPALRIPQNGASPDCYSNQIQRFNTSCQINCNPGYQLAGSSVRTCMENGEWSGLYTICTGMHYMYRYEVCLHIHKASKTEA